jgi:hypothetical protein
MFASGAARPRQQPYGPRCHERGKLAWSDSRAAAQVVRMETRCELSRQERRPTCWATSPSRAILLRPALPGRKPQTLTAPSLSQRRGVLMREGTILRYPFPEELGGKGDARTGGRSSATKTRYHGHCYTTTWRRRLCQLAPTGAQVVRRRKSWVRRGGSRLEAEDPWAGTHEAHRNRPVGCEVLNARRSTKRSLRDRLLRPHKWAEL